MSIEKEVLVKCVPNCTKLLKYGFVKGNDMYKFSKKFMDNTFSADIVVFTNGEVHGKVIEIVYDEEYTNFRIEGEIGKFAGKVKSNYVSILEDIKEKCFDSKYFVFDQTNRITNYIFDKYGDRPEFLWKKYPGCGVFRKKKKKKWYGIIMDINKNKICDSTGEVEILNVKLNKELVTKLLKEEGFYKAYHMQKINWITIVLDDSLDDEKIMKLIDISYSNIANCK